MSAHDGAFCNLMCTYRRKGHFDVSVALIEARAQCNLQDKCGYNALIVAALKGESDIAKSLLALSSAEMVNAKDKNGYTSLIASSLHGHIKIVQALLEAKAEIDAQDNCGYTALIAAASNDNASVVFKLLDANASINLQVLRVRYRWQMTMLYCVLG